MDTWYVNNLTTGDDLSKIKSYESISKKHLEILSVYEDIIFDSANQMDFIIKENIASEDDFAIPPHLTKVKTADGRSVYIN